MLLIRTATGKNVLIRTAPRRRAPRGGGGGGRFNRLLEIAMIKSLMK
jgi:hypothetical protein